MISMDHPWIISGDPRITDGATDYPWIFPESTVTFQEGEGGEGHGGSSKDFMIVLKHDQDNGKIM